MTHANALKGEVGVRACGTEYILRFSTAAACRYETAAGKSFLAALAELAEDAENVMISKVVELLTFALGDRHPGITNDEVCAIVDDLGMVAVSEAIAEAAHLGFDAGARKSAAGNTAGNGAADPLAAASTGAA